MALSQKKIINIKILTIIFCLPAEHDRSGLKPAVPPPDPTLASILPPAFYPRGIEWGGAIASLTRADLPERVAGGADEIIFHIL